jgi:hypothetical protein
MFTLTITKKFLSGNLAGLTVSDSFTTAFPDVYAPVVGSHSSDLFTSAEYEVVKVEVARG